jgi:hypothetical protein
MVDTLKTVTLVILFLIYVPSFIAILVKAGKTRSKLILLGLTLISLPVLYLIIYSYIPYYELTPFAGRVIDVDTREPIEGAAVLAVYYDQAITVAGTNTYPIDAQETLTDEKGEFKIPEVKRWFGGRPGTVVEAAITIFKPSYGVFPRHPLSVANKVDQGGSALDKNVIYELPELKTREERARNVSDLGIKYNLPFSKQKMMIQKANEEFGNLTALNRYVEKHGKPFLKLMR